MSGNAERHAVPEPIGREARLSLRKKSLLPATLTTAQGSFECRVLNLSAGGAKLECTLPLAVGDRLTLMVPAIGTFSSTVIWREGSCFGVRFDTDTAKPAALGGTVLTPLTPLSTEPAGSELTAESTSSPPALEPSAGMDTKHAQGPLSELLREIKNLRANFEQATHITSKLSTELLFRAYLLFQQAVRHNGSAITLRSEVKRLGLMPSSRSELQHLAVDVAFPRTKVSPSLRTLYAKAIAAGHSREYTAQQFLDYFVKEMDKTYEGYGQNKKYEIASPTLPALSPTIATPAPATVPTAPTPLATIAPAAGLAPDAKAVPMPAPAPVAPAVSSSVEDRLNVLKDLRDRKVITPEEYTAKRKEILKSL